jgi:hypothetical protein
MQSCRAVNLPGVHIGFLLYQRPDRRNVPFHCCIGDVTDSPPYLCRSTTTTPSKIPQSSAERSFAVPPAMFD